MKELREKFLGLLLQDPERFGMTEARFVHSPQVIVTRSVRLRCQYTCLQSRQCDLTPPMTPTSGETRAVLDEYKFGFMVRREETFGQREIRNVWREFADHMIHLEEECIVRGYPRSFALGIGNCLYLHHGDSLRPCDYPGKSRPTLESLGVELKDTFEILNWEEHLVREPGETFQMFGLLMIE